MIDIEQSVTDKFPGFAATPSLIKTPTLQVLRKLIHEQEINAFLKEHGDYTSFEFIDRIFDYFNFSYSTSNRSRNNIPAIRPERPKCFVISVLFIILCLGIKNFSS